MPAKEQELLWKGALAGARRGWQTWLLPGLFMAGTILIGRIVEGAAWWNAASWVTLILASVALGLLLGPLYVNLNVPKGAGPSPWRTPSRGPLLHMWIRPPRNP